MSSANRVRLSAIAETIYGATPATGDFTEVDKINEDLTGNPLTVESGKIRSDRQSGGQITTGLELSGGFGFELSFDASLRLFIEQAMMSDLVAASVHTNNLTISGSGTSVATATGDFTLNFSDGDMCYFDGMDDAENNTVVMVSDVLAGSMTIVGEGLVNGAGTGATATRPAYHNIGTSGKSVSLCKEFLDVADANIRSLTYTGMRVSEMSMSFAFGNIITGRFGLAGNGYDQPVIPLVDGRTVTAIGSHLALDASNGFGWLLVDNADIDICIESLDFTLNNNLAAQNCIGSLAPTNQIPGSTKIDFNATMHLGITSWDKFMAAKLSQDPVSISFFTRDSNNAGYGVVLDRVQVSFPDPSASGKDATVTLAATGVASYDSVSGNTMRVYILQ